MDSTPVGNPAVRMLTVSADYAGQRVDNFLKRELKGVPKSKIYNILRRGEVRVNKARVKPDYKLCEGDLLRIPPVRVAESVSVQASDNLLEIIKKSIIYQDADLMIVNKPSGLAVHGGSGVSLGLIEAMRQLFPEQRHLELVHRLDRDTSGCVILSLRRSVLKQLHELFKARKGIDKRYVALVSGKWPARKQRVDAPLQKNVLQSGERMVRVELGGKRSLTEFSLLERYPGASLVEARPVTGRTHQIRVHCQYAGHSILGDDKYCSEDESRVFKDQGLKRLFLHARSLGFTLGERRIEVEAPLPHDLSNLLKNLSKQL